MTLKQFSLDRESFAGFGRIAIAGNGRRAGDYERDGARVWLIHQTEWTPSVFTTRARTSSATKAPSPLHVFDRYDS